MLNICIFLLDTTAAVEWHFVANGQNRYRDSYLIKAMWPFSLPDF